MSDNYFYENIYGTYTVNWRYRDILGTYKRSESILKEVALLDCVEAFLEVTQKKTPNRFEDIRKHAYRGLIRNKGSTLITKPCAWDV